MLHLFQRFRPQLRTAAARFGWFALIFTVLPALGALAVAWRASERMGIIGDPFRADPTYTATVLGQALGASLTVAAILAIGSLVVWRRDAKHAWFRVARLHLLLLSVAYVLYPTLGAKIPVLGRVPLWIAAGTMLGAALAAYLGPWWRARVARATCPRSDSKHDGNSPRAECPRYESPWRELAFGVVICALFLVNPTREITAARFAALAGRTLNERDIVLVGFDSMTHEEMNPVLTSFQPRGAAKTIFENATTPMASTNTAWRSIFSGNYPEHHVLPVEPWGHERQTWLPTDLRAHGYVVSMVQDDATTNIYSSEEQIDVPQAQGWKWMLQTFLWRTVFPLSEVGAAWWLEPLGGPVYASSRQAYNPAGFQEHLLKHIAESARHGPILVASHSCHAHVPLQLTLREIVGLKHWWLKSSREFYGGVSYFSPENINFRELDNTRNASMHRVVARALQRLQDIGVLGHAQVFVLSDHGRRASWATSANVHHVMLAAFSPGPATTQIVSAPVSLVDIAPTIRRLVGLPDKSDDGEPLVLDGCTPELPRRIETFSLPSIEGGSKALFNPAAVGFQGNVTYRADGTFLFSPKLKDELHGLIERENRKVEGIRRMLERAGDG